MYYLVLFQLSGFLLMNVSGLGGSDGKASVYNAGDLGSSPGLGRYPGEGNGNPLQYFCLGNSITDESGGLQFMGSEKSWI